jgi:diguanylate cyclase (GGDEF)-like protein
MKPSSQTILLIEDNINFVKLIRPIAARQSGGAITLVHAKSLGEGLEILARDTGAIDCILLDLNLHDSEGLETFRKTHQRAPDTPIVVLTALEDEGIACRAVGEGAQDYLYKGDMKSGILIRAIRYAIERKRLERELRRLSITDNLTELFNQRCFFEEINQEVTRARRMKYPLCLIVFDLDNFKQYNDTHGHLAGDEVLRGVGRITRQSIRMDVDTAYRYGGDEFAVLLPNTEPKEAWEVAERIKKNIAGELKGVNVSVGISFLEEHSTIKDFIQAADLAMYLDKSNHKENVIPLKSPRRKRNA